MELLQWRSLASRCCLIPDHQTEWRMAPDRRGRVQVVLLRQRPTVKLVVQGWCYIQRWMSLHVLSRLSQSVQQFAAAKAQSKQLTSCRGVQLFVPSLIPYIMLLPVMSVLLPLLTYDMFAPPAVQVVLGLQDRRQPHRMSSSVAAWPAHPMPCRDALHQQEAAATAG